MKFARIDLLAFGPFTGSSLDFSYAPSALQVVYGSNEAGKSSTLRALSALLYGFPPRTGDAHVHEMAKLRVGATLLDGSGRELRVVRRKGAKNTLLSDSGEPLADQVLEGLLGGVSSAPLFEQMFGLDHERLRQGAEALLRGGGHLGEGLFDAGTGGAGVRRALDELRAEAEALYKQRGRTPKLNAALEEIRALQKRKNDALLSPQAVSEQREALAAAQAARARTLETQRALRAERSRLGRAIQLYPLLVRERGLRQKLAEIPLQQSEGDLLQELARGLDRRFALALAAEREEPRRSAELALLTRDIAELRARLGALAESLRALETPLRARLSKLAEEERSLRREQSELARALSDEAEQLALYEAQLAELAADDGPRLPWLLEELAREDVLAESQRVRVELDKRTQQLERALLQLGTTLSLPALAVLLLPSEAQLSELELRWGRLESNIEQAQRARAGLDDELARLERSRAELLSVGAPVSAHELAAARSDRDRALDSLLQAAQRTPGQLDRAQLDPAQVRAHAELVHRADELADRMRREVQQASELARLQAGIVALAGQRTELGDKLRLYELEQAELARSVRAITDSVGLPPHSPRAARPALLKLAELRERDRERAELEAALTRLRERAADWCERLCLALDVAPPAPATCEALARLLTLARERHARDSERAQRRASLLERTQQLALSRAAKSARRELVQAELAAWSERYGRELAGLGFTQVVSPDELLACLEELALLAQKLAAAQKLELALSAEREERALLGRELERALAQYLPELRGSLPAQALEALSALARERASLARDHTRLAEELGALERELARLGDGVPAEQLWLELSDFDLYAARARNEELEAAIAQCSDELGGQEQTIGRLEGGLERLEASSGAAELAEELEAELSRARALARRYVEVRLALSLLGREVERYRAQHQQPLLARASALFPRLTLGRYQRLEVEYDERDEPVLACIGESGKSVRVSGLSDGTRDQLYLALRIASIERYLEHNPALPLVLDDAFIHFDDQRAAAALGLLAELTHKTQVLFFTHHARMVELAEQTLGPAHVAVHRLGQPVRSGRERDPGPLFTGT